MSYIITKSSVFETKAQTIVNTVNCVGFMGAGLALEFKLRYPELFKKYQEDVKKGLVKIGIMNYYEDAEVKAINFPTKLDFKNPSKLKWIEMGLDNLIKTYKEHNVTSIAIPKLGSRSGGLDWEEVKHLIIRKLRDLPIPVYICEDSNPPEGTERKMLDFIKGFNLVNLGIGSNLYRPLERNIKKATRFFDIRGRGVGIGTYEKAFNAAYSYANNKVTSYDHRNYGEKEIMFIHSIIEDFNLKPGLFLEGKEAEELKIYLKTIAYEGFSFYEFLGPRKSMKSLIKFRDYVLEKSMTTSLLDPQ